MNRFSFCGWNGVVMDDADADAKIDVDVNVNVSAIVIADFSNGFGCLMMPRDILCLETQFMSTRPLLKTSKVCYYSRVWIIL